VRHAFIARTGGPLRDVGSLDKRLTLGQCIDPAQRGMRLMVTRRMVLRRFLGVTGVFPGLSRALLDIAFQFPGPHAELRTGRAGHGRFASDASGLDNRCPFARHHFRSVDKFIGVVRSVSLRGTAIRAELQPRLFPKFVCATVGASTLLPQSVG